MKKLIEVAMPLDAINRASAREKSIRHGHPSTLHLWWARRPLATARAVLFASLVDDPSEHPELFPTPQAQQAERERLFAIIDEFVTWENSGNEKIFAKALAEIKRYSGDDLPAVFDPFAGGGTIPLEAQRLGLKAYASDLNPVAVVINKAMIELPAKFKDRPPVSRNAQGTLGNEIYRGAEGLAADILHYGKLLKSKAFDKIGDLYPKADGMTVIAWLWARTVPCSNPACLCHMPLVHSFKLSTKQKIFVQPVVEKKSVRFEVRHGVDAPEGTVNRNGATCIFCGETSSLAHVRAQAKAGNMGAKLMAIVVEGERGRIYLAPDDEHIQAADVPKPDDFPDAPISYAPRYLTTPPYGMENFSDLFTNRQLTALTTFSDLLPDIRAQIQADGGSEDYADAVTVYMAFLLDKLADYHSGVCNWNSAGEKIRNTFGRQAIPMQWDFAEANPFSNSSGCFDNMLGWIYEVVRDLPASIVGETFRHSALEPFPLRNVLVSCDPPYYDNIGYANLSEFFYVWLRRSIRRVYPQLFGRMTFPKDAELIAEPARFDGDKTAAKNFFEDGMFKALQNIHAVTRADYPATIYYAFKQREAEGDGEASTGWETMLTAIIRAGFQITSTLPMRTEMQSRMRSHESNALASSVVLACRKRPPENKFLSKNDFLRALKTELKPALDNWTQATIAPVDMAQAAIGPGISVYSRYDRIADMNDTELTIRDALVIINAELDEYFNGQSRQMDAASQFCVDIYTQSEYKAISFGDADVLARAKNISVDGLKESGAVSAERGVVRLKTRDELSVVDANRQLNRDGLKTLAASNCAWLWVQTLVDALAKAGLPGGAELLANYDGDLDLLKKLAYRLYDICERQKRAKEGTRYNDLVVEWQEILDKRNEFMRKDTKPEQITLL